MGPDRVPRLAGPFAAAVVVVMVASALFLWEPWPFTSFRLFSQLRTEQQTAWVVTAVDAHGSEHDYPLGALSHGFRGFPFVMAEFVNASTARRDELCRTWVSAAPELIGVRAVKVRISRRTWDLARRRDDRALPGQVQPAFLCTPAGARSA